MAARAPLNQTGQITFPSGKGVLETNALLLSKTEMHAALVWIQRDIMKRSIETTVE